MLKALSGHTQIKSLEDMEKLVAEWKAEYNASWDADDYYNGHRVGQYTEWNRVPQFRLTSMAYALSGLERQQDSCFVLDIGTCQHIYFEKVVCLICWLLLNRYKCITFVGT